MLTLPVRPMRGHLRLQGIAQGLQAARSEWMASQGAAVEEPAQGELLSDAICEVQKGWPMVESNDLLVGRVRWVCGLAKAPTFAMLCGKLSHLWRHGVGRLPRFGLSGTHSCHVARVVACAACRDACWPPGYVCPEGSGHAAPDGQYEEPGWQPPYSTPAYSQQVRESGGTGRLWHPLSCSASTSCMSCREPSQRSALQLTPLEDLLGRLHAQVSASSSHHVLHIIQIAGACPSK